MTSFLSPARQTTGGQAAEENVTVEEVPLEDAPGGGIEESKNDHQDDDVPGASKEDPADPQFEEDSANLQFEEEPVDPQSSALEMALDLAEDNVPVIDHCAEESQKAHNNMMNQEEPADEAEVTQRCTELQEPTDKLQKDQKNQDNL